MDGEHEVFEELDDPATLQMIQSDNAADVVHSNEDEADDFDRPVCCQEVILMCRKTSFSIDLSITY
jgi:hypothetical protein